MKSLVNLNPKPTKLCCIDASTNSLAFSIFDNKRLIYFGKIKFDGKDIFTKVRDASKKVGPLLNNFEIEAIVIEHTVFMNSPKTMNDLAMIQGAIIASADIKTVKTINPIAWQTYLGNGKLTKEEKLKIRNATPGMSDAWYKKAERDFRKIKTINVTNIEYGLDNQDNDVADAIGIGHYSINNWEKLGG